MGAIADKMKQKLGLNKQQEKKLPSDVEVKKPETLADLGLDGPREFGVRELHPPKDRKCCATKKGQEHLATCPTLKPPRTHEEKLRVKEEKRLNLPQRLPNASIFRVVYNGELEKWSGTLDVDGKVFEGENSAVFKLLRDLDKKYRKSLEVAIGGVGDDIPKS